MPDKFKPRTFAETKSETLFIINASAERGHTGSDIDDCQAAIREERLFQNFHALDKLLHFLCRAFMLDWVYTVLLKVVYGMSNILHF